MRNETVEMQTRDSDMIFTQITKGDFADYRQAEQAVIAIYIPDLTISRSGISHVLGRLKRHYAQEQKV